MDQTISAGRGKEVGLSLPMEGTKIELEDFSIVGGDGGLDLGRGEAHQSDISCDITQGELGAARGDGEATEPGFACVGGELNSVEVVNEGGLGF